MQIAITFSVPMYNYFTNSFLFKIQITLITAKKNMNP